MIETVEKVRSGKYIIFEGIDGSGKSKQLKKLHWRILTETGLPYNIRAQPSDGPIGEFIRKHFLSGQLKVDPIVLQTLFAADHLSNLLGDSSNGVLWELETGHVVLQDRGFLSGIAYGSLSTQMHIIHDIMKLGMSYVVPDLIIYIDIDPEIALKRISENRNNFEIYESHDKLTKIRNNYHQAIETLTSYCKNIEIINGDDTVDNIAGHIWDRVSSMIIPKY